MNRKASKHIKRVATLEAKKQGLTSKEAIRRLYKDIKKAYKTITKVQYDV